MVTRSAKCLWILLAGTAVVLIAGWITGYWDRHLIFTGPVITLAVILSATISNNEKSRKLAAGTIFWTGLASTLLYSFLYTPEGAPHPERWGALVACAIVFMGLSQMIYAIQTRPSTSKSSTHFPATPKRCNL